VWVRVGLWLIKKVCVRLRGSAVNKKNRVGLWLIKLYVKWRQDM
jgi:hypothetical protein